MEKLNLDLDDEKKETESYDSEKFTIEDGELTSYFGNDSKVIIPDGVKAIGNGAFNLFGDEIEEVRIPKGCLYIGPSAFVGCDNLKKVIIPDGLLGIGYGAFCGCSSLKEISIPNSVKYIGNECFRGCDIKELNHPLIKIENGLAIRDNCVLSCVDTQVINIVIPENIEIIGSRAFYDLEYLESVTIPPSVKVICDWAFSNCYNLKSITTPNSVEVVVEGAFAGCKKLDLATIFKKH